MARKRIPPSYNGDTMPTREEFNGTKRPQGMPTLVEEWVEMAKRPPPAARAEREYHKKRMTVDEGKNTHTSTLGSVFLALIRNVLVVC